VRVHDVGDYIYIGNHSSLTDDNGVQLAPFRNSAGVATDPTTVTILIEDGAGVTTAYTWPTGSPAVSKEATGRFYVARTPTAAEAGFWYFRLAGTGAVQTAEQGRLFVREQRPASP
jgi:hypothetical protein